MKERTPKKVRQTTFIIFGVGALVAFLGILMNEEVFMCMMGIGIMFVSIVYNFIFYHCPHCGRYLGRSTGEYCPYCGKKVNE